MKLSTTAAAVLALAAAQGANAIDFDFRDFEGLWESAGGPQSDGVLATVTCGATGDFRKAMCELEAVISEELRLCSSSSAVVKGRWILDQFDADTGMTDDIMVSMKCCDPARRPRICHDLEDAELQATMRAGKSNRYVRAIDVTITAPGVTPPTPVVLFVQMRKTAGGFKSYN